MKLLILLTFLIFTASVFAKEAPQVINMQVTEKGFEPSEIKVKSGTHVTLKVTRKTEATCATQIKTSNSKKVTELPLNKEVTVDLGVLTKGNVIYACGMDMVTGHIIIQ